MKRWSKPFWLLGLTSVGLLVIAAAAWHSRSTAQADTAVMKVVPASQTVDLAGGQFSVDVFAEQIDDPNGLAAFEFKLAYDPVVIRLVGVGPGPFPSSTGRNVSCSRSSGREGEIQYLQFGCGSIAQGPPWGPTGSGLLATVTFAPRAGGTTPLAMTKVGMVKVIPTQGVPDENIPVTGEGGSVTVVGTGPEPTPEPDEPTPIPTVVVTPGLTPVATPVDYSYFTPEPGETPMTRPIARADTSRSGSNGGTSANSGTQGTTGSTTGETAGGSPRAGTGPPEQETARWPTVTGALLAAGGAVLLSLAVHLQRAGSRRRI
jgi:hypothetical protein